MQLLLRDNLPYVSVKLAYQGQAEEIQAVLVDTGSATTILAADLVASINIFPLPDDLLFTIRGVGGSEVVFTRKLDYLQVGDRRLPDFAVEIGGMDYGFEIKGILGMDFLMKAGAVIDLQDLQIDFSD